MKTGTSVPLALSRSHSLIPLASVEQGPRWKSPRDEDISAVFGRSSRELGPATSPTRELAGGSSLMASANSSTSALRDQEHPAEPHLGSWPPDAGMINVTVEKPRGFSVIHTEVTKWWDQ